jgi:hypothetical protein
MKAVASAERDVEPHDYPASQGVPSQLSQPHSLYSEELGYVPFVAPALAPVAGELIASDDHASKPGSSPAFKSSRVSKSGPSQVAPSTDEDSSSGSDPDFEKPDKHQAKISMNPRAAKSYSRVDR